MEAMIPWNNHYMEQTDRQTDGRTDRHTNTNDKIIGTNQGIQFCCCCPFDFWLQLFPIVLSLNREGG